MTSGPRTRTFARSLLGRIILSSLVPCVAVLVIVVAGNAYRKYHLMLEGAQERLALQVEALAGWVNAINASGVEVANTLQATCHGAFGDRERTMAIQQEIAEHTTWAAGIAIAYEPNADGNDASSAGARGADAAGRFLPYWFRDWRRNNELGFKLLTGMATQEWYLGPKERFEKERRTAPLITEPYDYEGKLMVSCCAPIEDEDAQRLIGVCCVDIALDTIQSEVSNRAKALGADIYLMTSGGLLVVVADGSGRTFREDPDSWRMKRLEDVPLGDVLAGFNRASETGRTENLLDPNTSDMSFFAASRIPAGRWTLVMSVPAATVTGPILTDTVQTASMAGAGIVAVVLIVYFPARRTVRRVDQAAQAAREVASGDLTRAPSRSECDDETGDLLRSLDSMTDDLNALVGQVRGASVELTSTATELSATSRQQESVVASFGASTTQIAAAVREITATGQELSREMDHVNDVATSTARLAQDGRVQLESMEGAMQSLDTATAGVADRLAAINEKAVNIGGVVTTITKVAEQTNLLSVNAAIEAEKAGEYGRGFLVVAREIRRLADQTGQATLDIERMVKEMQGAVSSGVMEMDRFSEQVRRNVGDVRTIGRSMNEIIGSVAETSRSFGNVREGMQSQASGAAQISDAMTTLTSNAKATGEAVREFGRAAEDLQRAIGMLKSAIAAFHLRG
jgi:methyl-accepting chemotaxis protein